MHSGQICGAKLASPERPAFAYVGDGAWASASTNCSPAPREKIGVTVIVFNNQQWGRGKEEPRRLLFRGATRGNLENPAGAVARAFWLRWA